MRRRSLRWSMALIAGLALLLGSYRAGRDSAELPELVWVTPRGTRYHTERCRYARGDRVGVRLDEARGRYRRCRVCGPPR